MPDENILREKAMQAVRHEKMPNRQPDRLWGGPGVGAACTICGLPVKKEEMELEVQFTTAGRSPAFEVYHVHVRCFAAWELVRTKAAGRDPPR